MIKKFSLLVISLIAALFFCEIFFRFSPMCRYDFEQFVRKDAASMSKILSRKDYYPIYKASDILGYERIPFSAPYVNSYGLIGKDYPLKKKKDTFRILVIGDSVTERNYYVKDIERSLNNSGLRFNFEVWNAGTAGYNLSQYTNYLKYKGVKFNPDMVIIGFCPNDFDESVPVFYKTQEGFIECYNPANNIATKINVSPFLLKHSFL